MICSAKVSRIMTACATFGKRKGKSRVVCPPRKGRLQSYNAIVKDYVENWRPHVSEELRHFARQPNLECAIRVSSLAIDERGKRHPHQRRIPGLLLKHFAQGLARRENAIRRCEDFAQLIAVVESVAATIWKNARLTVYDTAHRIGIFRHIAPDFVYIHAGTREGAVALGFSPRVPFVVPADFPKEFRRLKPHELEDCLCSYKEDLKEIAQTRTRGSQ